MRYLAFAACLVLVASLFGLVLGLGFELNEGWQPGMVSLPSGALLLVSAISLVWLLRRQGALNIRSPLRRRPPPIAVDPVYAAYAADPAATATCEHLRPIEAAMRQAGIRVDLRSPGIVSAWCRLDTGRLTLPPPLIYDPDLPGDRYGEPGYALLRCPEHHSSIGLEHPVAAPRGTPVFPA